MAINPDIESPDIESKANSAMDLVTGFREMTIDDVPAIMEIEKQIYTHPWTRGIFLDCMRVGYNCWVYLEGDELLAYGLVSVAVNEAHILNICVSPHVQGRGLGRLMLYKLMQLAADRQGHSIFLEVRESNLVAQKLYDQEGFNRIGLRKSYYPADDGREDALVFAKELNLDRVTIKD